MPIGSSTGSRLIAALVAFLFGAAPLHAQNGAKKLAPGDPVPIVMPPGTPTASPPVASKMGMEPDRGRPVTSIPVPKRPLARGMPPDMLLKTPAKDATPSMAPLDADQMPPAPTTGPSAN